MAFEDPYERFPWEDLPSTATPLDTDNLHAMEDRLAAYAEQVGLKSVVDPDDADTLAWNAALGEWEAVVPAGSQLLAQARNITGVVTSASAASSIGAQVVIPNTQISVPNSSGREVVLYYGGTWLQTVAGDGTKILNLRETTGAGSDPNADFSRLPNTTTVPQCYETRKNEFRIGVVTTARTFELRAQLWSAANSPTAQIVNAANNPSFLRAIAYA